MSETEGIVYDQKRKTGTHPTSRQCGRQYPYHIASVFNAPRQTTSHRHVMPVTLATPNSYEVKNVRDSSNV